FRVFFDDGAVAIAGTVDAAGAERLKVILRATHLRGVTVRLDLSRLEFVDHYGCAAFASFAEQLATTGGALEIVGSTPIFRRVWDLLGYDGLGNVTIVDEPEQPP